MRSLLINAKLPSKAPWVPNAQQLPQAPWSRTGVTHPWSTQLKEPAVASQAPTDGGIAAIIDSATAFCWRACSCQSSGGTIPVIWGSEKSRAAVYPTSKVQFSDAACSRRADSLLAILPGAADSRLE